MQASPIEFNNDILHVDKLKKLATAVDVYNWLILLVMFKISFMSNRIINLRYMSPIILFQNSIISEEYVYISRETTPHIEVTIGKKRKDTDDQITNKKLCNSLIFMNLRLFIKDCMKTINEPVYTLLTTKQYRLELLYR